MADKCGKCGKTVYKQEEIKGAGKVWHKMCFKCMADGCNITLTLKDFMAADGKVYCKKHVPKPKAKQVADDVATKHACSVPKKVSESVGNVQKGDQKVYSKMPKPVPSTGTLMAAPEKKEAAPDAAPAADAPPAEAPPAEAPPAEAPPAEAPPAEAPPAEAPPAEAPPAEAPPAEAPPAEAPPAEAPPADAPPAEAPADAPPADQPPAEAPADAPPADAPPADAPPAEQQP